MTGLLATDGGPSPDPIPPSDNTSRKRSRSEPENNVPKQDTNLLQVQTPQNPSTAFDSDSPTPDPFWDVFHLSGEVPGMNRDVEHGLGLPGQAFASPNTQFREFMGAFDILPNLDTSAHIAPGVWDTAAHPE